MFIQLMLGFHQILIFSIRNEWMSRKITNFIIITTPLVDLISIAGVATILKSGLMNIYAK